MDRFPSPWRSEKVPGGYAVRDASGRIVAHIFGRTEPWICPGVPAPLTLDEAKEMAVNIAKAGAILLITGRVQANSPRSQVAA
jgi:hypothetical protein